MSSFKISDVLASAEVTLFRGEEGTWNIEASSGYTTYCSRCNGERNIDIFAEDSTAEEVASSVLNQVVIEIEKYDGVLLDYEGDVVTGNSDWVINSDADLRYVCDNCSLVGEGDGGDTNQSNGSQDLYSSMMPGMEEF